MSDMRRLTDHVGETIVLESVAFEAVRKKDPKTGREKDVPRVIFTTVDEERYVEESHDILNKVMVITHMYGPSPWKEGLAFDVVLDSHKRPMLIKI